MLLNPWRFGTVKDLAPPGLEWVPLCDWRTEKLVAGKVSYARVFAQRSFMPIRIRVVEKILREVCKQSALTDKRRPRLIRLM